MDSGLAASRRPGMTAGFFISSQSANPGLVGYALHFPGWCLFGVDAVLGDRSLDLAFRQHVLVGERLERGHRDIVTVNLKELAQRNAIITASEAVGAEADIAPRNVRPDLIGKRAHVVCRSDDRSLPLSEA